MAENPAELILAGVEKCRTTPRDPAWTLREIAEHVSHVDACAGGKSAS